MLSDLAFQMKCKYKLIKHHVQVLRHNCLKQVREKILHDKKSWKLYFFYSQSEKYTFSSDQNFSQKPRLLRWTYKNTND